MYANDIIMSGSRSVAFHHVCKYIMHVYVQCVHMCVFYNLIPVVLVGVLVEVGS